MKRIITNQELFNEGWRRFVVNGESLAISNGDCLYRGPEGTRCLIGGFIPDEKYSESMEDKDVEVLSDQGLLPVEFEDLGFAIKAQAKLHDNLEEEEFDLEKIKEAYLSFADDYNLSIPGEST